MLSRLSRRLNDALSVVRCPGLPKTAKARLLGILSRRSPKARVEELSIPLRVGCVSVHPSYYPDFAAFRDVFLREVYGTCYDNAVVLDLGAHKGYFTLYALARGAHKIIAFEPEQKNFEQLEIAIKTTGNKSKNICILREGISDQSGEAAFYVAASSWSHSLLSRSDVGISGVEQIRVRAFREAVELARDGCDGRRLIVKMDIEGAECRAILGTSAADLGKVDEYWIEMHDFAPCETFKIEEWLIEAGFSRRENKDPKVFHFTNENSR